MATHAETREREAPSVVPEANEQSQFVAFLSDHPAGYAEGTAPAEHQELMALIAATPGIALGPNIIPALGSRIPPQLEGRTRILITRPIWGGTVDDELVQRLRIPGRELVVVTLSSGTDHIQAHQGEEAACRVVAGAGGNAREVAEYSIYAAIGLRRQLLGGVANLGFGVFARPGLESGRTMRGTTWCVIGPGAIGRELVAMLRSAGPARVVVAAAGLSGGGAARLMTEVVGWGFVERERSDAAVRFEHPSASEFHGLSEIEITTDRARAIGEAEIISIHVPPGEESAVTEEDLSACRPDAILINAARRDSVDEPAVLRMLEEDRLGAFASDVLGRDAETPSGTPLTTPRHPVWSRFCGEHAHAIDPCQHDATEGLRLTLQEVHPLSTTSQRGRSTVMLTPHAAGTSADASAEFLRSALDGIRAELGR